jgi:hypothetical protein
MEIKTLLLRFSALYNCLGCKATSDLVTLYCKCRGLDSKDGSVLGRQDYHSRHEPILYGWKPGAAHRWFGGRKQQSVTENDSLLTIAKEDNGQFLLTFTDGIQHIVVQVPDYALLFQGDDALTSIWKVDKPLKKQRTPYHEAGCPH